MSLQNVIAVDNGKVIGGSAGGGKDAQINYEIIDGTIDSIGANAKKTITLSPTIPTGKKVIGWSMYAVDSDLQTYMQYYGNDYILCVKNIGSNAMNNKDYRVVFIYGQ